MRRIAAKVILAILFCGVGGLLFTGCLAYMVRSVDTGDGVVHDGLGRELKHAPFVARYILGAERLYAGATWFVIDLVVFWTSVILFFQLGKLAGYLVNIVQANVCLDLSCQIEARVNDYHHASEERENLV